MQLITDIQDIKLYYPFLRGGTSRVNEHLKDIVSYLLLCDKVIISPSHIFNENVVRKNTDFLKKSNLLNQLFKNGLIITTSTDKNIRDYKDIIEQRSGYTDIHIPGFSLPLFYRDADKQKSEYMKFFLNEFTLLKNSFQDKDEYQKTRIFMKNMPGHSEILRQLRKLSKSESKLLVDTSKHIALITYLKVGAEGNNAIMPTLYPSDSHTFFNDYYSLQFVRQFAFRLSKLLKIDITNLPFEQFLRISMSLKAFKDDYFSKSQIMKDIDNHVYSVLVEINGKDRYRKYKRTINYIAGLIVGELIEDIILPSFNNTLCDFSLKVGAAFLFEKINLFDRIFSIVNETIKTANFNNYLTEDLGELIDKFDNGIKLAK